MVRVAMVSAPAASLLEPDPVLMIVQDRPQGKAARSTVVDLGPRRPGHRYFSPTQADGDRLLDALLQVHAAGQLGEIVLAVDPALAAATFRAHRFGGALAGARMRLDVTPPGPPSGGLLVQAVDAFLRGEASALVDAAPAAGRPARAAVLPSVSVIVPVRDVTDYLAEALDSARCSYEGPLEIVVVDDGSSAVAASQVRRIAAGARVIRQEPRGLPAARNAGVAAASGRYVVPLDADDLLEPGFVTLAVLALERYRHLGYLAGYVQSFGALTGCLPPLGYVPGLSLVVNTFARATAVLRRSALEAVGGYSEDLGSGEDWDLYLRLHAAGLGGSVVPRTAVRYRRHEASMTFSMSDRDRRDVVQEMLRRHGARLGRDELAELTALVADLWLAGYEPSASRELLRRYQPALEGSA